MHETFHMVICFKNLWSYYIITLTLVWRKEKHLTLLNRQAWQEVKRHRGRKTENILKRNFERNALVNLSIYVQK